MFLTVNNRRQSNCVYKKYGYCVILFNSQLLLLLLLLLSCAPVRDVCPNHEVVMLQPQIVTPMYPGSVINCCVATPFFLTWSTLLHLTPDLPLEGMPAPAPWHYPVYFRRAKKRIISPHGRHLYPYQNTNTHRSLPHLLTPLCPCLLLRSRHSCEIINASPLPPPQSLLT